LKDQAYCWKHSPENAEGRALARKKGGLARQKPPPPPLPESELEAALKAVQSVEDLRRLLGQVIAWTATGRLDYRRTGTVAALASSLSRTFADAPPQDAEMQAARAELAKALLPDQEG
jgi:hypothetical protein